LGFATLQRLEQTEERAFARLTRAIEHGNEFQIKSAQEFYLRCSETLRRVDLAVEIERRNAVELIPQKQAEAVSPARRGMAANSIRPISIL
jgi:hypothetical protein